MITLKWSDGVEVLDDSVLFSKLVSEKPASVTEAFEDSVREDCDASGIVGLIEGGVSDIVADWFAEHAERNPDFVEECFGYTPVYAGDSVVGWMTDEETVDTDEMAARVVADHPCILDDFREDFDDKSNKNFVVLINPEIVKYEGDIVYDQEGCLSVKDVYGNVPRYSKVRVRAIDIHGNRVHFKSPNAFVARVLQHEIDHTNGICFVDHIAHDENAFSLLTESGDLVACPYSKVLDSGILPADEDNNAIVQ